MCPIAPCGRTSLYNTTKERPQDRGTQVSLSMASLGGRCVHVHEVIEKADREVFRCSLSGHASDRWLEVPAWMFDRAVCTAWRIAAAPHVDPRTLGVLVTLLQDATANSHTPSQLEDSGAASGPHDANRGEVHAAPAYDISVRSVLQPARRADRADATMAGAAGRDAPDADKADGAPDPRPRRRRAHRSTGGGAP
ncbi:conserved hypothetical protein [Mesorhizobium delmotii]|uniref:Uncharacterized protein n=1 Tax=Mesorhizobium delmotii TaxID=1631247 RepID=A0A2P9AUR7_9HYPH|nr:conserved hypothetical protein [Mesorhizobium delmotii]